MDGKRSSSFTPPIMAGHTITIDEHVYEITIPTTGEVNEIAGKGQNPLAVIYSLLEKFVEASDKDGNKTSLSQEEWEKYHPKHTQHLVTWLNENVFGVPLGQVGPSLDMSSRDKVSRSKKMHLRGE